MWHVFPCPRHIPGGHIERLADAMLPGALVYCPAESHSALRFKYLRQAFANILNSDMSPSTVLEAIGMLLDALLDTTRRSLYDKAFVDEVMDVAALTTPDALSFKDRELAGGGL